MGIRQVKMNMEMTLTSLALRRNLPATPLKLTQRFFPGILASKKCRKTSTERGCLKWLHSIANALMKAQLRGGHVDFH